jgi:Fe-S-cluster-containing dehydrogenase component
VTIKKISQEKCEHCSLRASSGCPVMESCHTDAIRLDEKGIPYIAYSDDCDCCFMCSIDCPLEAVVVSAKINFPFLTKL